MLIFKMIEESICDWIIKNDNEIQKLRDKNKILCEQYWLWRFTLKKMFISFLLFLNMGKYFFLFNFKFILFKVNNDLIYYNIFSSYSAFLRY